MKRRRREIAAGPHSPPAPPESSLGLGRPFAQKKVTHFELKIFRLSPISIKATLDQMFVEIGVDMAKCQKTLKKDLKTLKYTKKTLKNTKKH